LEQQEDANMPVPYFCRLVAVPLAVVAAVSLIGVALAQTASPPPAPFTQAEVTAGHGVYAGYCVTCHGEGLEGGGDAPPLGGAFFNGDWSKYDISRLYAFVANAMPQGLEGELKPQEYSDVIAFLLAANGAKPGTAKFDKDSKVQIGSIITGVIVPGVLNAPLPPADAPQ
jgi:mono/diheme cytochrome c family protein